jgi:DHA1 family multidrug resistance protein-like MFS transporter
MDFAPVTGLRSDRALKTLRWAVLLGSLSFGILQFALPIYARQLGASALDIGGVISIFAAMITVARPLVGWGIDRWGRKLFLTASFVFYGLSMLLFGFARNIGLLYAARLVQGVGSALLWIPAYTTATELAAQGWGRSVGSVDMSSSRGGFFGTFLGFGVILLASSFALGWRWAFMGYALAALVAAAMIWRGVPETGGAAASSARSVAALDRKLLFRLMMIVFLTGASSSMISPLLMIFLQDHFTTNVTTLAIAFIPAAIVYSYLPARLGGLSDRFGRAPLMTVGLVGAGLVSLGMPATTSLFFLAALWVLEAVGLSAASPAEAALVADLAGRNVRGRGYGLYMFASGLGFTIGPLIGGWLYDAAGHPIPFYVNGAILFVGAALVLLLLGRGPRQSAAQAEPGPLLNQLE